MNQNFENHVATVLVDNDDLFSLDWRNKDGGSDYYVRYIVDKKLGTFYISGDIGSCVSYWYHSVQPRHIAVYIRNLPYFISKIECSSDKYIRTEEQIKIDLDKLKAEIIEERWVDDLSEIDNDFKEIENYFLENLRAEIYYDQDIIEIFEKYCEEWWEVFDSIGIVVHPRLELWSDGFNLALEQLGMIPAATKNSKSPRLPLYKG